MNICLNIECDNTVESYSFISSFLKKLSTHERFNEEELKKITYTIRTVNGNSNFSEIIKNYNSNPKTKITKFGAFVKDIYDYNYSVVIHTHFGNDNDITELVNFVLIRQFYTNIKIYLIVSAHKDFYFKISQYLALLSKKDLFHDYIYFDDGQSIKRLQQRGIGALHDYVPLLLIEGVDFINSYFGTSKDELFEKINNYDYNSDCFNIYGGCKSNLEGLCDMLKGFDITLGDILSMFRNQSPLSVFLFCYTINGANFSAFESAKSLIPSLIEYVSILEQYSSCIRQLVENVMFHSAKKQGVLSVRSYYLDRHSNYLNKKYGKEYFARQNCSKMFCEITISDYSGNIDNGNIAEHFLKNIDSKYKGLNLKPQDFFADISDSSVLQAWSKYYSDTENLGKHYGLKMFKKMVEKFGGIFIMETHSSHENHDDECYSTIYGNTMNSLTNVIPGTFYQVLLPVNNITSSNLLPLYDVSLTSDLTMQWCKYIRHTTSNIKFKEDFEKMFSIDEKVKILESTVVSLKNSICCEQRTTMLQCNAETFGVGAAEIICKALIICYGTGNNEEFPHFIFYNCSPAFKSTFISTMSAFWGKSVPLSSGSLFQIALFDKGNYTYSVLIPGSCHQTSLLNKHIAKTRARNCESFCFDDVQETKLEVDIIPFDVLCCPDEKDNTITLFEKYTYDILNNNVQSENLGCKISDTHMRLGSSIHIDDFYEAEILFSNKLFVSSFAFLLVKKIRELKNEKNIVLYGYAAYSEMLLYNVKYMLTSLEEFKEYNIEIILLERESEHRSSGQMDIIREKITTVALSGCTTYYIIPINSTMKTLSRMYDKLMDYCSDNNMLDFSRNNRAFTVITIAPDGDNDYWSRDTANRTITPKNELEEKFGEISYFVTAKTNYYGAVKCRLCYPTNPLHEKPLIEVNASSTIPHQSFKKIQTRYGNSEKIVIDKEELKYQIESAEKLRSSLIYGHSRRGENHFWYYLQTEVLMRENNSDITDWLHNISCDIIHNENYNIDEFNIIFCPMHFSNIDFAEAVNNNVFNGAAMVICIDVDKEYRSNFNAKYSNISGLANVLNQSGRNYLIRVHYVDDTIITARTFNRAKSLLNSLFWGNMEHVNIFDTIILLVNRNSDFSSATLKNLVPLGGETRIYSFITLKISSLRTHGNSCVLCNLCSDAYKLSKGSSTSEMGKYWLEKAEDGFGVKDIPVFVKNAISKEGNNQTNQRNFLRMLCSHMLGCFLDKLNAYLSKQDAFDSIIELICMHLEYEKNCGHDIALRRELFYSYLKVLTRPFISFDKFIKEATFDMLLVIIETLLSNGKETVEEVLKRMCSSNDAMPYPKNFNRNSSEKINKMLSLAEVNLSEYNIDLLKILMKQLSEMKSNYVIRAKSMNKIFNYVNNNVDDFIIFYSRIVKRLVGVNSDTGKSVWLDYLLIFHKEKVTEDKLELNENMRKFVQIALIENTRVYYDAIEKLSNIKELNFVYNNTNMINRCYILICEFLRNEHSENEMDEFFNRMYSIADIKNYVDSLPKFGSIGSKEKLIGIKQSLEYIDHFDNDTDEYKSDMERISKHIGKNGFIFENFNTVYSYLLQKADIQKNPENDNEVIRMINDCTHLLRLIDSFNTTSEDKPRSDQSYRLQYYQLAIIMEKLLKALSVSIMIRNESATDAWQVDLVQKAKERGIALSIDFGKRSEYTLISTSQVSPEETGEEYYPANAHKHIDDYVGQSKRQDFYINSTYYIWEIAIDNQLPVYIYAEFYSDDVLRDIRIKFLMMLRHKLCENVFGKNVNRYIYELAQEHNELIIQKRDKSHTHTRNSARSYYYRLSTSEDPKKSGVALILLSDLVISETFRQSLAKEFYLKQEGANFSEVPSKWCDSFLYNKNSTFSFESNKDVRIVTKTDSNINTNLLEFLPGDSFLQPNDEFIMLYEASNVNKPFLFLVALAQNAIKQSYNSTTQIDVFLTKTNDNCLRICHKIDYYDMMLPKRISESMLIPPANRDSGITMWSISRYIKAIISKTAFMYLEHDHGKDNDKINELISENFEIKPEILHLGQDYYLSIKIPFLKEKYNRFLFEEDDYATSNP